MAVRIRLARAGAKGKPFYRVVVTDSPSPRDGRYLELLGTYDPKKEPPEVKLKVDRIRHWLGVGARPTDSVKRFLKPAVLQAQATAAPAS
jgi:small subunit ribosomal protein S16